MYYVSILISQYFQDGVVWHDIECRHKKPVICQESQELLDFAVGRTRSQKLRKPTERLIYSIDYSGIDHDGLLACGKSQGVDDEPRP